MEEYTIPKIPKSIKLGKYENIVYDVHKKSYGDESAGNILKNATKILKRSFEQEDDLTQSNNVLLVGKVQSGKTSNLEMLTALAFDNGYNCMIIYGGYDNNLLSQAVDRFSLTFNTDEDDDAPCLISTLAENFSIYDDSYFEAAFADDRPVIIAALKRSLALEKLNDTLTSLSKVKLKAFIIDDEGDQASLNTKKNKIDDASATYDAICKMKKILGNPLYFSTTATPQANIFQPEISKLMPSSVHLIPPADSYTGGDDFHLQESNIIEIDENDLTLLDKGQMAPSLVTALNHFIISSAIMLQNGMKKSDMIVHSYRKIEEHSELHDLINYYIQNLKDSIHNDDPSLPILLGIIRKSYSSKNFTEEIINKYPWDEAMIYYIKKVIKTIYIVEKNSKNKVDESDIKAFKHKIYIGGDLLQRGITFKNLVTTYFTRWSNTGNMDTTLQRARWFGYREKYLKLCRIFTTTVIKHEFANLAQIDNDLWNQFELVEKGELALGDIIIDANDTSLNPTRKNVSEYQKASFAKKWNNQMYSVFDMDIISKNNSLWESFISSYSFNPTLVGRNDNKPSAYFSIVEGNDFLSFVNTTEYIFDKVPFSKVDLNKLLANQKICIELMTSKNELNEYRRRSFFNGKVSALQQGADTTNLEKQHYKGDASVIEDNNLICIQVFKILPMLADGEHKEFTQYMYSIHFPKKQLVYKKK